MDLEHITPLILTYNEAPNISRTLERLQWAKTVLIVDSHSSDDTLQIVRGFPNTVVVQRTYDHFADQCNFGLRHIQTEWTLSLDADYVCPTELPSELATSKDDCDGYSARFRYCVYGQPLRGTLYPSRVVLYRTSQAQYVRDGHAHRVTVPGQLRNLNSVIDHDDRKPFHRWLAAQTTYAQQEAEKLLDMDNSQRNWKDTLRRSMLIAPIATLFYCLVAKGLVLDGWPGIYYTLQRVYAELLLSLELLDRRLIKRNQPSKFEKLGRQPDMTEPVSGSK